METKEIIDALQVKRSLVRISHEIIEHNRGVEDIVLIGIKTRGEILANRLADIIENVEAVKVPCFALDVSHWRDDRAMYGRHCETTRIKNALSFPIFILPFACAVSCGSQPPCAIRKQNVIISRCARSSPVLV